jgi:cell division protein FtsW (lipid II flippase)
LPFVSYSGSEMVVASLALGLLASAAHARPRPASVSP